MVSTFIFLKKGTTIEKDFFTISGPHNRWRRHVSLCLANLTGAFNLVNDGSSTPYASGELIASGSFTFSGTATGTLAGYDAVAQEELFVVDRIPDSGFGNISYTMSTASDYIVTSPLYALLDQISGNFVGLHGELLDIVNSAMLSLTLTGINTSMGGATYDFMNLTTTNSESGYQVPEPSALAFLSVGLIAFGYVRRKTSA